MTDIYSYVNIHNNQELAIFPHSVDDPNVGLKWQLILNRAQIAVHDTPELAADDAHKRYGVSANLGSWIARKLVSFEGWVQ